MAWLTYRRFLLITMAVALASLIVPTLILTIYYALFGLGDGGGTSAGTFSLGYAWVFALARSGPFIAFGMFALPISALLLLANIVANRRSK